MCVCVHVNVDARAGVFMLFTYVCIRKFMLLISKHRSYVYSLGYVFISVTWNIWKRFSANKGVIRQDTRYADKRSVPNVSVNVRVGGNGGVV